MIRIQSVNPHFGSDAKGEKELSEYIEARLAAAGLPVHRQRVFPGRDNLIVELRTGHPESTLLFEAHMDTVTLGSMENPLTPIYRDGRIYGRGACDTKGSLAGMIYALEQCARHPEQLSADIVLCASVDEEHQYYGLRAFLELNMPVAGAVVGEPTEMGIVIAHKGCARFAVQTHGRAAHSSMPQEGNSAIYQMADVIRFIREQIEPELAQRSHPLCGSPTIVVGTINGGDQINIVPESCTVQIDRRVIPGEDSEAALSEFSSKLSEFAAANGIRFSIQELLLDPPLNTPADAGIVGKAVEAAKSLGLKHEVIGVPYSSDASKLQRTGIPTIVYGPGSIAQAHSREEWVPIQEVADAAEFYWKLATAFR
jgi:acetylornithine deacetylase